MGRLVGGEPGLDPPVVVAGRPPGALVLGLVLFAFAVVRNVPALGWLGSGA